MKTGDEERVRGERGIKGVSRNRDGEKCQDKCVQTWDTKYNKSKCNDQERMDYIPLLRGSSGFGS